MILQNMIKIKENGLMIIYVECKMKSIEFH